MPTPEQIDAAKTKLVPQPYDANTSKLTSDAQADLRVFLVKFLRDTKRSGGYTQLADRLAAATGRAAAQLQAVLDNVSGVGSKVAQLTGEVVYDTQDNINSELEFALFVMYDPVPVNTLGTKESDMAAAIRDAFACGCRGSHRAGCTFDEYRLTRSRC